MKHWQIIGLFTLAAAGLGAAGYAGFNSGQPPAAAAPEAPPTVVVTTCDVEKTITAPGSLENKRQATVEMPAAGRLEAVLVQPGEAVKEGQTLARLAGRESFEAALHSANLDLLEAQQALAEMPREAQEEAANLQLELLEAQKDLDEAVRYRAYLGYPEEVKESQIDAAQRAYNAAQKAYDAALKAYQEVAPLPEKELKRQKILQALDVARLARDRALNSLNWLQDDGKLKTRLEADAELSLAQARVEKLKTRLEALQNGPQALELARAEQQAAQAEAAAALAQYALDNIELRAPFDGIVLEVEAQADESLAQGAAVVSLADPQALVVAANVIEEDLPLVQIGQPADLFFDAMPDAEVSGTVGSIVPKRLAGDRPLYKVYILLDQVPSGLVEGMTADVAIVLEHAEGVLCLPRSLVRAAPAGEGGASQASVEVWDGSQVETRQVQVGLRGDTNVAILSGLEEGELVVAR